LYNQTWIGIWNILTPEGGFSHGPQNTKATIALEKSSDIFFPVPPMYIDQEVPGCFLFMGECYVMQYMVLHGFV